jgi:hypothetical protein
VDSQNENCERFHLIIKKSRTDSLFIFKKISNCETPLMLDFNIKINLALNIESAKKIGLHIHSKVLPALCLQWMQFA